MKLRIRADVRRAARRVPSSRATPEIGNPRYLFASWDEVARRLARATHLALFTDFDGTLVPIHRRAASVRLPPRVRRLLADLVAGGHLVGVVSGRARDDIERLVALQGLWYVGDHGFLLRAPDGRTAVLISRRQQDEIDRVAKRLRRELRDVPGITVESKVATLAVHYRGSPAKSRTAATQAVAAAIEHHPNLRLMAGKKVWEVLPAVEVDKARVVRFILRWERLHTSKTRWLAIYIGDDLADERVFAGWRGLSVAVGRTHPTVARYYLRSPADVWTFLERLAKTK